MRRQPRTAPSMGYTPRTVGRLVVLLVMVVLIIFLGVRLRDPRGWAWLAMGKPAAEESLPTQGPKPPQEHTAPDPDREMLKGAADREPFLVENRAALVQGELFDKQRRDADARYALLLDAAQSLEGSLFADARRDIRFADLLTKPAEYRGEIVYIRGDLLWIKPLELKRTGKGLKTCYQGLLTVQTPDRAYWLLFTDLPPGLPDPNRWGTLYLPNVEFAGYFYKVLAVDPAPGSPQQRYLPVLVGKTLQFALPKPATEDLPLMLGVFAAALAPVLLITVVAWWLYRRNDRRRREKMTQVRERAQARDEAAIAQLQRPDTTPPEPHHNGQHE